MGCCNSKPDDIGRDEICASEIRTRNDNNSITQQVPPIVITKAQSIASINSLRASTSANVTSTTINDQAESEKPPVIIEERTQEHQYGEPPAFEKEAAANSKAIIKDIKPVQIVTPQSASDRAIIPAPEQLPNVTQKSSPPPSSPNQSSPANNVSNTITTSSSTPWTIFIRLSTSGTKDKLIDIPTSPPFMTVAELKNEIDIESDQQIKLIHLGRILQDNYILVPSSTTSSITDTIKVSNRGVIQAMVYRK